MFKKFIIFFSLLILLGACSSEYDQKLKISATTWIGYSPLFYAKEKGWLDTINIKLLNVSSLSENMYLYKAGNSDAYVGTQYEYNLLSKETPTLKPIIMFDRSNGGDIVLSNVSISQIQKTTKTIDAYLEMDSVNNTILKDFIKKYQLEDKNINYINKDQSQIAVLEAKKAKNPTIIVSYIPYNITLVKNGFQELVSTKDGLDLLVVDAMFTTSKIFNKHEKQFLELHKMITKAITALKKNPEMFYKTIQPYMLDMNSEEFLDSLEDIIWINDTLSDELKERLLDAKFPIRDLI